MRELEAVTVKLSRGSFTLRADNAALAELEDLYDKPFDEVVGGLLANMKIREVCKVTAIFARAAHPEVTDAAVLKAAPIIEDLKALREGIMAALFAALPPKKDAGDQAGDGGGGEAPARPFANG